MLAHLFVRIFIRGKIIAVTFAVAVCEFSRWLQATDKVSSSEAPIKNLSFTSFSYPKTNKGWLAWHKKCIKAPHKKTKLKK